MDMKIYGAIEFIVFFGGVLAFCLWQLRIVRRSIAEDAERKAKGEEAPAATPGKKSAEDVFWDTVTKPRPKR